MVTKFDVFEDVASAMDSWVSEASEAMTSSKANLQWVDAEEPYRRIQQACETAGLDASSIKHVLAECLRGFSVSFLTVLDGGSALAEKGRVYLVDESGRRLGEGLHDDFVTYLLETGRIT